MAMSREQMLQVLGTMDTGKLVDALSAAGVDCGCGPGYQDEMGEHEPSADGLVSWNATEVRMPTSKRPALFDKHAHVEKPQVQTRKMELPPEETGMGEWAPPMAGAMGY